MGVFFVFFVWFKRKTLFSLFFGFVVCVICNLAFIVRGFEHVCWLYNEYGFQFSLVGLIKCFL